MQVPFLKGKKVILRPLSFRDAPNFCKWLADSEVTVFLTRYQDPPTLNEERKWIQSEKRKKNSAIFAIDAKDGKHIGVVSLNKFNTPHKRAIFGIFIGDKEYWGQGCGTESTLLILSYGFRRLHLHRIYLEVLAYNTRGIRSYKRCGFHIEGRQRDHIYSRGSYHDMLIMGILKNEWLKNNPKKYGRKK